MLCFIPQLNCTLMFEKKFLKLVKVNRYFFSVLIGANRNSQTTNKASVD